MSKAKTARELIKQLNESFKHAYGKPITSDEANRSILLWNEIVKQALTALDAEQKEISK